MISVSATEAQTRLAELLAEAQSGNPVEIHTDDGHKFRLIAEQPAARKPREPGSCKGFILHMAEDFDAPLEELREYWE